MCVVTNVRAELRSCVAMTEETLYTVEEMTTTGTIKEVFEMISLSLDEDVSFRKNCP